MLGCVNAVWKGRAVTLEDGIRLYLEPMRGVVREMEDALAGGPSAPKEHRRRYASDLVMV